MDENNDMMDRVAQLLSNPESARMIRQIAASLGAPADASAPASAGFSGPENDFGFSAAAGAGNLPDGYSGTSVPPFNGQYVPFPGRKDPDPIPEPAAEAVSAAAPSIPGTENLSRILSNLQSGGSHSRDLTLLNAVRPFLRASRAGRLDSAVRAIRLIDMLSALR